MIKKEIIIGAMFCFNLTCAFTQDWHLGGNTVGIGQSQRVGTNNNRNFRIETTNIQRAMFNRNISYTVNGFNTAHNGYMLLGTQTGSNNVLYNGNRGPYSQLHITGANGGATQSGYRPWMKTGVTFTASNDIAYVGMRNVGHNVSEYTMAWGNNQGNNGDDMVFRFVRQGNRSTYYNSDLTDENNTT